MGIRERREGGRLRQCGGQCLCPKLHLILRRGAHCRLSRNTHILALSAIGRGGPGVINRRASGGVYRRRDSEMRLRAGCIVRMHRHHAWVPYWLL